MWYALKKETQKEFVDDYSKPISAYLVSVCSEKDATRRLKVHVYTAQANNSVTHILVLIFIVVLKRLLYRRNLPQNTARR